LVIVITDKQEEPVIQFIYEPYERYYDNAKFIYKPAERMVEYAKLSPGQQVLDIACGTGLATMAAAKVVGETGSVIGLDIHSKFLEVAREKAASAGQSNIEYHVGDAEKLEFANNTFDAVICASSIFYFKDILQALQGWYRVLKSGGKVAFTSFGDRLWQPILRPLGECLSKYDNLPLPVPFIIERTNTPEKCYEFLQSSGFQEIDIVTEHLDCRYPDTEMYWQDMALSFVGPRLANLSSDDLDRFRAEHLSEMESLYQDEKILVEFPTYICLAKKI
jgi:ubiquinone/menaquinone biosynthesis C-methylase UbiE